MAKFNNKKNDISSKFKVNDEIRFHGEVRIVGEGIESKVVPIRTARDIAESMGLDLVEIQGNREVPIMKICQFDKMIYELKKAAKKVKQQTKQLKEVKKITGVDNCGLIKEIVCKLGGDRFIKDGRVYYRLPNTIE